jgi:hypothetical protein
VPQFSGLRVSEGNDKQKASHNQSESSDDSLLSLLLLIFYGLHHRRISEPNYLARHDLFLFLLASLTSSATLKMTSFFLWDENLRIPECNTLRSKSCNYF